jgi:hypothetical protein
MKTVRCVPRPAAAPENMLDAMERFHLDDNSPDIEVLEGQLSVEELLAELGLEWRPEPAAGEFTDDEAVEQGFSQPVLF